MSLETKNDYRFCGTTITWTLGKGYSALLFTGSDFATCFFTTQKEIEAACLKSRNLYYALVKRR